MTLSGCGGNMTLPFALLDMIVSCYPLLYQTAAMMSCYTLHGSVRMDAVMKLWGLMEMLRHTVDFTLLTR